MFGCYFIWSYYLSITRGNTGFGNLEDRQGRVPGDNNLAGKNQSLCYLFGLSRDINCSNIQFGIKFVASGVITPDFFFAYIGNIHSEWKTFAFMVERRANIVHSKSAFS